MPGYAGVILYDPKDERNVSNALRACGVFGASFITIMGWRVNWSMVRVSDPSKQHRNVATFQYNKRDGLVSALPAGVEVIGVEITPLAEVLPEFEHPERAVYIFGPEDGSLPDDILSAVDYIVKIPSKSCLNLAACVNVVLYDRAAKEIRDGTSSI